MRTSHEIAKIISSSINKATEQGALDNFNYTDILVQKPKSDLHGTWSTNIALVISKIAKKNPMEIAEIIKRNIPKNKIISQINIMKPGFINIEVSDIYRAEIINKVIKADDKFGSNNFGNKEKVQIEFVSVNPTGPVHVGHARGAVVGSCLANILTFSDYDVTREYYVNDAGTQIDLYVKSILYHIYSKFNLKFDNPKDGYKGEFIENIADEIINEFNIIKNQDILSDRKKFYLKIKKTSLKNTISRIENDLRDLGVE
ncbi:MAG: arginine--tRNA ligase, partial [Chloroflexi bacterium]|nr:arginine--tRNA ligase [Chloroflexota bacterium]